MRRRRVRIRVLAGLVVALLAAGQARAASDPAVPATVGSTPVGQAMPSGFLGISVEYKALHLYTGRDPRAVDPVLLALIRGISGGQPPVVRVGGDSTDWTWWPIRGVIPRGGISYAITKGWLRTTQALAADLGARLILGVNLASGRAALAAAEARVLLGGIGRRFIVALEIGNEPDLYGVFPWYRDRRGHVVLARGRRYRLSSFIGDFSRWRKALPSLPLVGPSFSALTWLSGLTRFLGAERTVRTVTIHRYPLHNSTRDPSMPTYPSITNLLSDASSSTMAQALQQYVSIAHSRGLPFRVDEMNSVSGGGRQGVSDTFASALWVLDTLFNLAAVGVDGVNIHTLPGAAYELFSFSRPNGTWQAFVHPEYYGMLAFEQAFPPGARLLPVTVAPGPVKVWATSAPDGTTHVVLINKDPVTPVSVQLQLPGAQSSATVRRLSAPSLDATSGVTLGGQSFGSETSTGTLSGPPNSEQVVPVAGTYTVEVPAESAALLTR